MLMTIQQAMDGAPTPPSLPGKIGLRMMANVVSG